MELKKSYASRKMQIRQRLLDFQGVWNEPDERIFSELAFCFCTPQSKAKSCWLAVSLLQDSGLLYTGSHDDIKRTLHKKVRFHNNKSGYILQARNLFMDSGKLSIKKGLLEKGTPYEMREWLVSNMKGIGYKEASHFLRNIGLGKDIAILDRHILKNLKKHGAIREVPKTLTPKKYREIENQMRDFSRKVRIPMEEMDLLFWSEETGEVFK
ncbi:MAG: N-glycosylase/DNA lyase [Candidatus Aenigmarchaeota archaeon]|nr:N-glycosylase/DNA lyase [Candidatus Aenigmarchaeota archaeon]